jgi:hypothetical protein
MECRVAALAREASRLQVAHSGRYILAELGPQVEDFGDLRLAAGFAPRKPSIAQTQRHPPLALSSLYDLIRSSN